MKRGCHIGGYLALAILASGASMAAQTVSSHESLMTNLRMIGAGVTQADLDMMRNKNRMAISYMRTAWREMFQGTDLQFVPPFFRPYTVPGLDSSCGPIRADNAGYCPPDHTIYYDEIFLASQMKAAAASLRTDGDYAPIIILEHEFGHAVAIEKGYRQRISLFAENAADCMAGVITSWARRDGHIDRGDLEEAYFAFSAGADPSGQPFAEQLHDPSAHGNQYQRMVAFSNGLNSGNVHQCVPTSNVPSGNYRGTR